MATEAGRLMTIAFKAVRQCQSDVGKLLHDLDGRMKQDGWSRLWADRRDNVTSGVTKGTDSSRWMVRWLYRLYRNPQVPNTVDGINVHFFGDIQEPLLVAGRAVYQVPAGKQIEDICKRWDLTTGFHKCVAEGTDPFATANTYANVDERIGHLKLRAVDLYSIENMDAIVSLFSQVRSA